MGAKTKPAAAATSKALPPTKNTGGVDPIPFTDAMYLEACTMTSYGLTQSQVADVLGISLATFERRIKERPQGAEGLRAAKAKAVTMVAQSVYRQALGGDRIVGYDAKGRERKEYIPPNFRAGQFFLNIQAGWIEKRALAMENGADGPFVLEVRDYRSKKAKAESDGS
jgi:hypothetical protein